MKSGRQTARSSRLFIVDTSRSQRDVRTEERAERKPAACHFHVGIRGTRSGAARARRYGAILRLPEVDSRGVAQPG